MTMMAVVVLAVAPAAFSWPIKTFDYSQDGALCKWAHCPFSSWVRSTKCRTDCKIVWYLVHNAVFVMKTNDGTNRSL